MTTINLFNLWMGKAPPGLPWSRATIGPFEVELVPEYTERAAKLGRNASKTISYGFEAGEVEGDPSIDLKTTTFSERTRGGWEVTATARVVSGADERSVLSREPIEDGGIWDLCTLLTFITGRRVTSEPTDRFDPNTYGTHACVDIEVLQAAACAWEHRRAVVDRKLVQALQMHNEGLGFDLLQVTAGLGSTAFNVLVDHWMKHKVPEQSTDAEQQALAAAKGKAKKGKVALKAVVTAAVEGCDEIDPAERASYVALLGSRIDQGLSSSLTDKTMVLLADLGVVADASDAVIARRVKFMNSIRNSLVHSGEPPELKGLTPEQSRRYTTVMIGVVQEIVILALGRVLGFVPKGLGSLSQSTRDLETFFQKGVWRDWPLEDRAFEDWFYADSNAIEEAVGLEG